MEADRKRRLVVALQRYVLNPPVKAAVFLGLAPGYALLETVGRRTGRRRRAVVGVQEENGSLWIVAEQGRRAGYVANLEAEPRVRVRLRGRWRPGVARVVDSDDPHARLDSFGRKAHARSVRLFGGELRSVRVDVEAGADPSARRSGDQP